ncbi:hypothetical protein HG531_010349 [Fusarium graminearum]|nr:hypothetical protein HG531_010349 [Fusarium graminearum]
MLIPGFIGKPYHNWINHEAKADIVNRPVRNLSLLLSVRPCYFKDVFHPLDLGLSLLLNLLLLHAVLCLRERRLFFSGQHIQHLPFEILCLAHALLLAIVPALLLAAQNKTRDRSE